MARKNNNKIKKKGPKGKKARARSKLNKHWGEQVSDEAIHLSKIRKGKSRLSKSTKTTNDDDFNRRDESSSSVMNINDMESQKQQQYDDDYDDDESQSSSNDDMSEGEMELTTYNDDDENMADEMMMATSTSCGRLLSRIKATTKTTTTTTPQTTTRSLIRQDNDSSSTTSSSDEDDDSDDTDDDSSSSSSSIDDNNSTNDDDNNDTSSPSISPDSPFMTHFSNTPRPEDDDETTAAATLEKNSQMIKINTPHLDESYDCRFSGPILDQWNTLLDRSSSCSSITDDDSSKKKLKKKLLKRLSHGERHAYTPPLKNTPLSPLHPPTKNNPLPLTLSPSLSHYSDIYLSCCKTKSDRQSINDLLLRHVLTHVLSSIVTVTKHDAIVRKRRKREDIAMALKKEEMKKNKKKKKKKRIDDELPPPPPPESSIDNNNNTIITTNNNDDDDDDTRFRDQGYTRPKVLLLLPTRGTALSLVEHLIALLSPHLAVDQTHYDRFTSEYSPPPPPPPSDDEDPDDEKAKRVASVLAARGSDWNELFGDDVNSDDDFKIGLSFGHQNLSKKEKKAGRTLKLKLYAPFEKSDIIVASPLGLKMTIDDNMKETTDLLSSLEIVALLRSDVLLMQNWDHVDALFARHLNEPTLLSTDTDVDFSRVRDYVLKGRVATRRQIIVISELFDPHHHATFRKYAQSLAGRSVVRRMTGGDDAALVRAVPMGGGGGGRVSSSSLRQVFTRVTAPSPAERGEALMNYFERRLLPKLLRHSRRVLFYIPSYFDFVALRNRLLQNDVLKHEFVCVTEYSRISEVSRGRARFFRGEKRWMLYTGRAHFFCRRVMRGARHVIFWGLPEHEEFYVDVVKVLGDVGNGSGRKEEREDEVEMGEVSCLSLFTTWEGHALERIVGREHCRNMMGGEKSTFMFC